MEILKFGHFTANFKELPPPLPREYLIPLYGVIIRSIIGWSIPSIIGRIRAKTGNRKLNHYHKRITSVYSEYELDKKDIDSLDKLKKNIADAYYKGKINELHYKLLNKKIEEYKNYN